MLLKLILQFFLFILILPGCGGDFTRKPATTTSNPQGGTIVTTQESPVPCPVSMPVGSVCSSAGTIVTTVPSLASTVNGPSIPNSYTFLSTPDANLCIDAFYRSGFPLPEDAIAKSVVLNSSNSNTLYSDVQTTTVPIMTIIDATQCKSNVMIQLLNKNGFYCIRNMDALKSNVTIQRSCDSRLATISPTVQNNAAARGYSLFFFPWFSHAPSTPGEGSWDQGYNNAGGSVKEVPCVP